MKIGERMQATMRIGERSANNRAIGSRAENIYGAVSNQTQVVLDPELKNHMDKKK